MLWNPDANADSIIEEYFQGYYPTTTKSTQLLYHYLEEAFSNITFLKVRWARYHTEDLLEDPNLELFPWDHFRYNAHHPKNNDGRDMVEIDDFIIKARNEFERSLMQCTDPFEKGRLLEDQHRFTYGENTIHYFYHQIRTLILERQGKDVLAKQEFDRMQEYAELLKSYTHNPNYCPSAKTGFKCLGPETLDMHKRLEEKYGAPGT
jgi:hypothetical protein